MTTQPTEIPETLYYFEDWNHGLGKKYILTPDYSKPIISNEKDGREVVTGYQEKRTEVPRC